MRKNKIFGFILVLISFLFITNVKAENGNEVTLNFEGGVIHDGYVEYANIGKLQLFKDETLVVDISNDMKIDLDESSYQFIIDDSSSTDTTPTRIIINKWYYSLDEVNSKKVFKLDTSKFYAELNIKLEKKQSAVNNKRKVEMAKYDVNEIIDLSKEYIIDFSKTDDLTHVLKLFADLNKTIYYKLADDNDLEETTNVDEAIIKVVGNKSENKAVISAINVGNKKEDKIKGLRVKYHYATAETINDKGILNIIEHLYYSTNEYVFTFKYVDETEEKDIPKEIIYKFLEGENQKYIINESSNAKFRIDADYSLFQNGGKVYIDDTLVEINNYTSESGSTIITLKKDYVNKLGVGEHKLKVLFNNGGLAESKFIIEEKKNEVKETIKNPQTGDNITTYIIIFVVSIVGIITTIIINKKKKEC